MTLLELLVKELPGRGGWPEDVFYVTQDYDGQVNSYGSRNPTIVRDTWTHQGFISYLFDDKELELCEEWNKSIITREQYEVTIAAQQQVWNGEGLPPVGCECEYIGNDTSWGVVKVIGYDEGRVVFKPSGEDYYGITPSYKSVFRPIRTEAERKREEVGLAIYHAINWNAEGEMASPSRMEDYRKAYDAIASGKIPGVEISK